MDKYTKLQKYADKLITRNHIAVKNKLAIIKEIALYLDAVIFNIISVFCLIAILNTPAAEPTSHITSKTMQVGKLYIEDTCKPKKQKGGDGRMGSATFLGQFEPMYSQSNPTNDILNLDFANGIARPQIGGSTTGCGACVTGGASQSQELHKLVKQYIKDILAYHKVSATKTIKNEILEIITHHLDCFITHLLQTQGMMTMTKLKKMVKQHKILHPPK